jgi:hypothetical protein
VRSADLEVREQPLELNPAMRKPGQIQRDPALHLEGDAGPQGPRSKNKRPAALPFRGTKIICRAFLGCPSTAQRSHHDALQPFGRFSSTSPAKSQAS